MGLFDTWNFTLTCDIKSACLYPGNVLQGCLHIKCTKDTKVRAVRLLIRGTESYHFSRGSGKNRRSYSGQAHIINMTLTLAGFQPGQSGEFVMPAGLWHYPFSYMLPANLTPSFVYQYGSDHAANRYRLTGYVDIPWGKDAEIDFPFQVLSVCPLSQWQANQPLTIPQNVNVFLCCNCLGSKGNISINSRIQRTLLVMGYDPAYIHIDIDSKCQEPIEAVLLKLIQRNTTLGRGATDVNEETVMKHKQPTNILPNTRAGVDLCFQVPRGILPSFRGINVFSEYFLRVEFDIPWASDPYVDFPVQVVQAVDHTNYFPPVQFQTPWCQEVAAPQCYVYQPPVSSVGAHPYTPMNAPAFQGGTFYQAPPPPIGVPNPDPAWSTMSPNSFQAEIQYQAMPPPIGAVPSPATGGNNLQQPLMGGSTTSYNTF